MKKVPKIIKNKGLINIFKISRSKIRNYLNKKKITKFVYLFIKFKNNFKNPTTRYFFYNNTFFQKYSSIKNNKQKKVFYFMKLPLFLLYIVYIKSYKPITNTLRFKKSMFLVKFKKIFKKFKIFLKNNSGRNNNGVVTIYSKCGLKRQNKMLCFSIWDRYVYRVISFFRNKKKLLSLCKHTTGSLSIIPHISGVNIDQRTFSTTLPKKYWLNNLPGNYVLLKFLDKFCIFSNINISGTKKIATSPGTFCQLVDFFVDFGLVKVSLPSKKCIFLPSTSFILLGKNSQQQQKFCFVGKAGTNKNLGFKPKVRGVARNPVDHPHGGRTKTNKPEVSIWG